MNIKTTLLLTVTGSDDSEECLNKLYFSSLSSSLMLGYTTTSKD